MAESNAQTDGKLCGRGEHVRLSCKKGTPKNFKLREMHSGEIVSRPTGSFAAEGLTSVFLVRKVRQRTSNSGKCTAENSVQTGREFQAGQAIS